MNVTMVGTLPPIKGISRTYCLPLAEALSRFVDIDFVGFSHIYPDRLYPDGTTEGGGEHVFAPGCRIRTRAPLDWFNPLGWLWTGLTVPGRLLHVHWWTFYLAPVELTLLVAAKLRRTPVVMTVHNVLAHETNALDRALTRLAFSLADHFIVHTEQNRRQLVDIFGVPRGRISIIPFGALTLYDDAPMSRTEARRRLGLDDTERVLLHFGNIRDYKGLDVLLAALRIVADSVPNVRLVVAGPCWTGWERYGRLIKQLDLKQHVLLQIGYVPTPMVKAYFRSADLVVLPYVHFEAQSGPGNIALAFAVPMIVTRTGGLPKLVRDADAVVPPGDAGALAEAIVACLRDDEKLARMADDSAALRQEYAWGRIARRTVTLYEEVLSGRGNR